MLTQPRQLPPACSDQPQPTWRLLVLQLKEAYHMPLTTH